MEIFPHLQDKLRSSDYTPRRLFDDLRKGLRSACASGDDRALDHILRFASWSLGQGRDLENAAIAGFYAYVFEDCPDWNAVLEHLTPEQISDWWVFWELSMQPASLRRLYIAAVEEHGAEALQVPNRWYLEDLAPDEKAIEANRNRQRDYLCRLLRNSLGFYTSGRLELWQLAKDVEVCLWNLSNYVDPGWSREAWKIWEEIEVINAVSLNEGRSTLTSLTAGERHRVRHLVARLREMIPSEVE